jgi:hypothetical protein
MTDNLDELVPDIAAAVPPPEVNGPEIRALADDALIGPMPVNKAEEGSARRASPLLERLLGYGPQAALVACLAGCAWLAGSYLSGDQPPYLARKLWTALWTVTPQAEIAEQIRALKAGLEAMHATQSLSEKDTAALEGLTTQLNLSKTETSAAMANLAGRVEQLERDTATKLSQIYERLDRIEHPIAPPTAALLAAASESAATVRKRPHGKRHDAFDPSQNPNAPGVPRPLGSVAPRGMN